MCPTSLFNTYRGWKKSCTTLKPWETIFFWYLQGNRIIPGFFGWCEMDFVHPHLPITPMGTCDMGGASWGLGEKSCDPRSRDPNAMPLKHIYTYIHICIYIYMLCFFFFFFFKEKIKFSFFSFFLAFCLVCGHCCFGVCFDKPLGNHLSHSKLSSVLAFAALQGTPDQVAGDFEASALSRSSAWVWLKISREGQTAGFGFHVSTYQGWYRFFEQPYGKVPFPRDLMCLVCLNTDGLLNSV